MKKVLFAWAMLACCISPAVNPVNAQEDEPLDRIHLGVIGGLHSTSTKFSNLDDRYFDNPKRMNGGAFGFFAEFEVGEKRIFGLRPQFMFLSRATKIKDINYLEGTGYGKLSYRLDAKYFDFRLPLMLNLGNPHGIRPYIYVAPVLGFVRGGDIRIHDAEDAYSIDVSKANMASTYFAITPGVGVKFPVNVGASQMHLGLEANYEIGITDTYSSKEKDGRAISRFFFPVYDIQGTRKFQGFEVMAHISVPLSIFKGGSRQKAVKTVYVEKPVEKIVYVEKVKPCYTLEEIVDLIDRGQSVEGKTICAIDQINFEFNKSTLTRESKEYVDKIAALMNRTSARVEVKGHTDDRGTDEYNMKLSKQRAEAVYNYLISKGVDKTRLSYSYYGKSQPIESNETEAGRRINRRVEFEIK